MRTLLARLSLALGLAVIGVLTLAGVALAASPGAATDTPDITDDLGSWAALVGIGLPPFVAVLQRLNAPAWANSLIFGLAVVVASVVYGWIKYGNDFTWAHWQGTLLAVAVWGIATYKLYWHPAGKPDSVVAKIRGNVGVR